MSESFFATLECELLARRRFTSQAEARMAVFSYIEGWYHPARRPFWHPLSIPNRLRDADAQETQTTLSDKPSTEPGQLNRNRTSPERVAEIKRLRHQRLSGPAIARQLAMPMSTAGKVMRGLGLGRLGALEPKPPVVRY
jgi:hypothetical protein